MREFEHVEASTVRLVPAAPGTGIVVATIGFCENFRTSRPFIGSANAGVHNAAVNATAVSPIVKVFVRCALISFSP